MKQATNVKNFIPLEYQWRGGMRNFSDSANEIYTLMRAGLSVKHLSTWTAPLERKAGLDVGSSLVRWSELPSTGVSQNF